MLTIGSGGRHAGETASRTGVCGLSRAIRQLKLATQGPLQLDYIVSDCRGSSFLPSLHVAD